MQIKNIILSVVASAAAINAAAIPAPPGDIAAPDAGQTLDDKKALEYCLNDGNKYLEATGSPAPAGGVEGVCQYCV